MGYTPGPVDRLHRRADQLHVDDQPVQGHSDDFFTNVPLPPDFATMWTQALQQGFKPKLATVANGAVCSRLTPTP